MGGALSIFEQRHKATIHVQLLMTVKQRQAGIIGDKVKFRLLETAEHHHVFHHARCRFAGNAVALLFVTHPLDPIYGRSTLNVGNCLSQRPVA